MSLGLVRRRYPRSLGISVYTLTPMFAEICHLDYPMRLVKHLWLS